MRVSIISTYVIWLSLSSKGLWHTYIKQKVMYDVFFALFVSDTFELTS